MKSLRNLMVLMAASLILAACFMSANSLIAGDEAVLPVDQGMVICFDPDDPCIDFQRSGDGYFAPSPDAAEPGATLRFASLAQAGGRQVYLVEADVDSGEAYLYGLARRLDAPDERGATMQIAALDCADLDDEAQSAFAAGGGTIEGGFVTSCQPASLEHLKAILLEALGDNIGEDAWWLEQASDL